MIQLTGTVLPTNEVHGNGRHPARPLYGGLLEHASAYKVYFVYSRPSTRPFSAGLAHQNNSHRMCRSVSILGLETSLRTHTSRHDREPRI